MGEENMIVTPLAPGDITHTAVTVRIERSPRRELTGGIFLHKPTLCVHKPRCTCSSGALSVFTFHPELEIIIFLHHITVF